MTGKASTMALAIHGLCFSYPDRPDVLKQVNLQAQAGERIGVIGANGAGKTTLFLVLCGILSPTAGEIALWGKPLRVGSLSQEVGLVFQNPDHQLFCTSVWQDVAFGPENLGLPRQEVTDRVEAALRLTGTLPLAERPPHHLSGGEKRMVAIAGVLAMQPQVVIYDEPSANLDCRARRRLIEFLQQSPQTLLIASHDLEFILETCQRVMVMDQGEVVADGETKAIMGNPALMGSHGLEPPHSLLFHDRPHPNGQGIPAALTALPTSS
ncbi:MAG: ABC transporter ATP-binding protein [Cyanobacteriota bacterium]|nr:ABC transporter ATP-binding protein [Cyanobacteriota bacterium]